MNISLNRTTVCRYLAIGAFGLSGSALAFWAGARVGSKLDHQTKNVSVARIPVPDLQQPREPEPVVATAVARK